ncbi:hypothetical protein Verru16b_00266 [Lacunisphaera limnophila]|uniref:Uncharacterized protein n=1 Tax=Lacunisphaera limnophila TaxID=1838286 RepID=A0A1I7PHX5_9BACT|nr:hypothetical protein [Lacunisphaera limnophila]AOS43223.1 hypothetical protein Verru16b_00266 [Lacunisphaera limnophila]
MKTLFRLCLPLVCLVNLHGGAARVEDEETSVLAQVFNDYTRTPSALGGYKAETFAFANAGSILGSLRDNSVDQATFNQVVRLISPALARQNYIAASDPEDTDLLISVTWGATDGFDNSLALSGSQLNDITSDWAGHAMQMDAANQRRDSRNNRNATLLGYREALKAHRDMRSYGVHGTVYGDLIADVEDPRYFVILTAFDFQTAWREKKLVPLWSTRYNIPTRGNHFTAALPSMSMFASRFFGRDSDGLVRRLNPTGKVDMGELQILGSVDTPPVEK